MTYWRISKMVELEVTRIVLNRSCSKHPTQGWHRLFKSFFVSQVGFQKVKCIKTVLGLSSTSLSQKDVCGTSEMHESCYKNGMWLMQLPQQVVQCQKCLADVLNPVNREPSAHSIQLPANFRVDHSKKEDGISL